MALESAGTGVFVAALSPFGAVTLGCATLAAARSCEGRTLHSLHAYFVRPVPEARLQLSVERVRDGRRMALRRVQVNHEGRLLFEMSASFAVAGDGAEFQDETGPSLPAPETMASEDEIARQEGWKPGEPSPLGGPFEWRWPELPWRDAAAGRSSRYLGWVRPRFALPRDHAFDATAIAYVSDYHSHMSAARKLGAHFEPWGYTSLDQVLWIHRNLHWDDWWIMTTECDVAHSGRALTRRRLHTSDGLLVASMVQEQLIPR